jgi:AraC family transcriptional regulator
VLLDWLPISVEVYRQISLLTSRGLLNWRPMEDAPHIGSAPRSWFGGRNLVLTGASTSYHVPSFAGPISIKAVCFGEVEWRLEKRSYLLRPDTLLLLPDGDEYAMTIDSAQTSRTFCPVFRRGLVEECWHVLTSKHETLLEASSTYRSPSFQRRLESTSGPLGQALAALAAAIGQSASPAILGWLFEALGAQAAQAICAQRGERSRLSSIRPATRIEIMRRLDRARERVEENLADPWSLVAMAGAAPMAPHHFHRCFRAAYRETPRQWLSRRRAERAMALLETTGRPVAEICLSVGYASVSSFSTSFAARFGRLPSHVVRLSGRRRSLRR